MRIESLENDESLPEELRNTKFNPKDWEIIDDPFSARATPPKVQHDATISKLDAIEKHLVQKIEDLTNSMHVEKQKSKADLNRAAFTQMDRLQVFDLRSFNADKLKEFSSVTKDIEEDVQEFNLTPKTDKRAKKQESAIIDKLEQRVLEFLNNQRVDTLTPVMKAHINFSAENKQLDPEDDELADKDEAPSVVRKKVVKKGKTVKTSGVKSKSKSSGVKSKVTTASKTKSKTKTSKK